MKRRDSSLKELKQQSQVSCQGGWRPSCCPIHGTGGLIATFSCPRGRSSYLVHCCLPVPVLPGSGATWPQLPVASPMPQSPLGNGKTALCLAFWSPHTSTVYLTPVPSFGPWLPNSVTLAPRQALEPPGTWAQASQPLLALGWSESWGQPGAEAHPREGPDGWGGGWGTYIPRTSREEDAVEINLEDCGFTFKTDKRVDTQDQAE